MGDCREKFIRSSLPARLMEDDAILDIKSIPSDTLNWLFPSNTFPPRTYYFSQISQPARICLNNRYFEEQIHWVPLKIDSFRADMKSFPLQYERHRHRTETSLFNATRIMLSYSGLRVFEANRPGEGEKWANSHRRRHGSKSHGAKSM